jgi:hypothetical protein
MMYSMTPDITFNIILSVEKREVLPVNAPIELTFSIEQILSWEGNSSSASAEIPSLLYNPKAHYLFHNSPPPVPILSHMNPIHTLFP